MRRDGSESPADYRKSRKYDHETEVVFALPPMQLHLVTKHNQAEHEPLEDGKAFTLTYMYWNCPRICHGWGLKMYQNSLIDFMFSFPLRQLECAFQS